MAVLNALREPGPHALIDIAARANLPSPTTHRYLQALVREGRVRTCEEPRGHYARCAEEPLGDPGGLEELPMRVSGRTPSPITAALVSLQARTGQVVLLHTVVGLQSTRMCTKRLLGTHGRDLLATPMERRLSLWEAPLWTDPDAASLVIRACLDDQGGPALSGTRRHGYASARSALPGWTSTAAPLRRGSAVVGAVSVLARKPRENHVYSVMETAGAISGYLTRWLARQAG
ncbi:helix-turn-helix domain-containing protein [Streptomyces sp. NPDC026673]|uniref:helix-turn-helix domain-containing protein n=1 Tax=Streptomyces sp. NPDC026673 TaxID=3155724 RepID=UPI003400B852